MLHDYRVHGVVIQLDKGEAIIAASPSDKSGYRLNEAFETIYAGLSLLAVKYPSNV